MRNMFSYVWLLLLVICCWCCMARHIKEGKQFPDDSSASDKHSPCSEKHSKCSHKHPSSPHKHPSSPHDHSSSSHEHSLSSSHEHSLSSSHEHSSSSSQEDSSSKEKESTCTNGKKNPGETDVDCGGKKCAKCADRKICNVGSDCISGVCLAKRCAQRWTATSSTSTGSVTTVSTESTTTTAEEESTTTTPEEESTTTTAEEESTTTTAEEEFTTTTAEEESTTTTAEEESTTTTPEEESTTTMVELRLASPTCEFECKNGGTCTDHNQCTCTTGFSGSTCEVQSVGLCLNDETFDSEPLLMITFGNGSAQYSSATPENFNFSTTYKQRFAPVTNDGMFSFINSIHDDFGGSWHVNAKDHTEDENGYMYLVNADKKPGQFYDGIVNNLCIGLRYEFSVYLANVGKSNQKIKPNVLFEVRSLVGNTLLAQLESGDVHAQSKLTWEKYGFSFVATSSSVNLLMISNAPGGIGNDLVIDDIALRVCAHTGNGFCPSNQ